MGALHCYHLDDFIAFFQQVKKWRLKGINRGSGRMNSDVDRRTVAVYVTIYILFPKWILYQNKR